MSICPCCKRPGFVPVSDRPIEKRKGATTKAQDTKRKLDSILWMLDQSGMSRSMIAEKFNMSRSNVSGRIVGYKKLMDERDRVIRSDADPAIRRLLEAGCFPRGRHLLSFVVDDVKWVEENPR
jgi:hypothetical protein